MAIHLMVALTIHRVVVVAIHHRHHRINNLVIIVTDLKLC